MSLSETIEQYIKNNGFSIIKYLLSLLGYKLMMKTAADWRKRPIWHEVVGIDDKYIQSMETGWCHKVTCQLKIVKI